MIKEAVHDYAAKLNKVFAHDRSLTVGASEIGLCERRVFCTKDQLRKAKLAKKTLPPPIEMTGSWGASVRGTVMEEQFWVPAMRAKYGKRLAWIGRDQRTLALGNLSATPDGVLTGVRNELREFGIKTVKSGCVLLECKTIDPRVTLREAKAENRYQVQVQMGLVRECTEYKPDYAVISYVNASFWDEVEEYAESFDPKIFEAAKSRADKILSATRMDQLKPEGIISGGRECEYCPFTKECYKDVRDVPKYEVDPRMVDDQQWIEMIKQQCDAVLELEEQKDTVEEAIAEGKLQIKDELKKANIRKIKGVVSWSPIKGAARVDNAKFQAAALAAGIDVDDYRVVGEPTDRFQILANK